MNQHDISRRRVALGMTGAALARELGVAPSTLLRWERGDVTIGPAMARLVELTLARLEKDQARRAAQRARYAARTRQNDDTLE
jgi:transcriptional regulator with XRE-family HTH domain